MKLLELRWPVVVVGVVLALALAGLVEAVIIPEVEPLTLGYWKTHSSYGPAERDNTWDGVQPDAEASDFFDTGESWIDVLWTPPRSNAFYILAHQYIAARLNVLNGAVTPGDVADAITHAGELLDAYDGDPNPMTDITGVVRENFVETAETLDEWNNSGE